MKRIYSLYAAGLAFALAGAVLLLTPPITVYACTGIMSTARWTGSGQPGNRQVPGRGKGD